MWQSPADPDSDASRRMEPGQFFRMRGFVHLGRIASFSGKVRDHHDPSTDTAVAAHTRGYIGGLMQSFSA